MNTKEIDKKETCSFYANEIHLEIMILPYINQQIEKNTEVYLINEENLDESIFNVIQKTNLDNKKKKEILKLDWKNTNDGKIKEIKSKTNQGVVLVTGSQGFNEKINKDLKNKNNFEIINCYNLNKTENIEKIKENCSKILNTTGMKEF